jgi:hypothetical protein
MTVHRFPVNVPNADGQSVAVHLRLQKLTAERLARLGVDIPKGELEVVHAGITADPCAEVGEREFELKLPARTSTDVYVVITTGATSGRKGAATAYNLIDERGGVVAGGVLLTCVERTSPASAGQVVAARRPCPVVLAQDAYVIDIGETPSRPRAKALSTYDTFEFVVPVTNPRKSALREVTVYLEHLGISDATFAPAIWNVGTMAPGDVFYATWQVTTGWFTGALRASVVVASSDTDAVRLDALARVRQKRDLLIGRVARRRTRSRSAR